MFMCVRWVLRMIRDENRPMRNTSKSNDTLLVCVNNVFFSTSETRNLVFCTCSTGTNHIKNGDRRAFAHKSERRNTERVASRRDRRWRRRTTLSG